MDILTLASAAIQRLEGAALAPFAAGFDKSFLNTVQDTFGKIEVAPEARYFLMGVFGLVLAILTAYFLRTHYKRLHYHLLAMFAGKGRLEDNRRILEYLAKAGSALEAHQGEGKRSRFLGEGTIESVSPAAFVLKVTSDSPSLRLPVGRMLTLYFRPILFKGGQYNNFSTYLERVSQPGSREYLLSFHVPMAIAYQRRRNHVRFEVERQSLIKGKLWLARWADGRSLLRFHQPSLRINMDSVDDASVHDLSAGGIRLVVPGEMDARTYKPGTDICMQLFLFNPGKGNYRWIWLGATVTKTFKTGAGLNVCLRYAALGSVVNSEEGEMRWLEVGVAEGLPGMNRVIGEWKEYLAGQEKSREALA